MIRVLWRILGEVCEEKGWRGRGWIELGGRMGQIGVLAGWFDWLMSM